MKIVLHASNACAIETGHRGSIFNINESDGAITIKSENNVDIEIYKYDCQELKDVLVCKVHSIKIKERTLTPIK